MLRCRCLEQADRGDNAAGTESSELIYGDVRASWWIYKKSHGWDPVDLICAQCRTHVVTVYFTALYCLNQELKFLYTKKQIPTEQLYSASLESASQWQGTWYVCRNICKYETL